MEDKGQEPNSPSQTYITFEAMRRIRQDAQMKGVKTLLSTTAIMKGLPGRKIGVCRAYVEKAQRYRLDAIAANVMQDFGLVESAPELLELVDAFARQDGTAQANKRATELMEAFCRANQKAKR